MGYCRTITMRKKVEMMARELQERITIPTENVTLNIYKTVKHRIRP